MSLSANYPAIRPSLLLDFINAPVLSPRVTFTRASSATYFDQLGVLQTAGNDVPRFDFDPVTLACRGLLIEEQRTNSIRNNTMQGAVAGTPGTLPTNWAQQSVGGVALTEVVGTGTENGINYVDVRFAGTTSSTASGGILTEGGTIIAALSGQTWAASLYIRLVGGSTAGITAISNTINERNAGGTLLAATNTTINPTTSALNTQRVSTTRTLDQATTAFVQQRITLVPQSGVAIDITLRIGLPQLELGAFATSVIPTTTAAVTRSADVASMTGANFSSWFNATEGTFSVRYSSVSAPSLRSFAASDGTTNNTIEGVATASNGSGVLFSIRENNTAQANIPTAIIPVTNQVYNVAGAYASNNAAGSRDGTIATDLTVNVPIVNRLYIGAGGTAANQLNGHIRRLTYYPSRLANAQLQALTAS